MEWFVSVLTGPAQQVFVVVMLLIWAWCLVAAAKAKRWDWLVIMLVFPPMLVIYLLFAHKRSPFSTPKA